MKKTVYLLLFALCSTFLMNAQTSEKKWNLGAYGGKSAYYGDLGNSFFEVSKAYYGFAALSLSRWVSPRFNVGLHGSYGAVGYNEYKTFEYGGQELYGDIQIQLKFVKRDKAIFKPYIFAGLGVRSLLESESSLTSCNEGVDMVIPAGLGLDLRIFRNVSLRYIMSFGYTNNDTRDMDSDEAGNDLLLHHNFGITFDLGPKIDTDGDGVADRKDKCPDTPLGAVVDEKGCTLDRDRDGIADNQDECPDNAGPAEFKGCPDTDKDGIIDKNDECPDKAGLAEFKGCPDTDKDGIIDKNDECPDKAGLAEFKGCPDTDKDGIEDRKDECPDIAGLAAFNGCPDTDGDSIIDSKDGCPKEAGPVETNGCPDRDKDGIIDKLDKCPDVWGIPENKGCPEIKQETRQIFEKALQGIQFETGKDVIKANSFRILNDVVNVMAVNQEYSLSIYGHTDNVGADDMNMTLSQKRAESVRKYLVEKGVPESRIVEVKGFGETMPVATNDTAEGRTLNRRVEFKVVF
jgi:OmpA-OmpF porin, OOP family